MIKMIIDILKSNEFYAVSEEVDIAKGKYHIQYSVKDSYKQLKRILKSKIR